MERRKFITLAAAGGMAVSFTGISCTGRPAYYSMLDKPQQLSYICDAKTIREIGMAYRAQTPAESGSGSLADLLSADSTGHAVSSSSDNTFIQALINQKIIDDFEKGHTVVINGWILSVTEARQCALFFLNNK
jgi:hypothetical protein